MVNDRQSQGSAFRFPSYALPILAVVCALAVCFASLRHTGSLSFPIDDGYIYSNYVLSGAQGHLFTYNAGETSGGITSLGWYILCIVAYWLLIPLHGLLGGLAPIEVQTASADLAGQTGHLYLAAYLPGLVCLILTALGVYRLAHLVLPQTNNTPHLRDLVCLLLGALTAADLGLLWGALSGLEVSLSSALVVWAIVLLLSDLRQGVLRWSLLLAALLPWARPDLLAITGACGLWLILRALFSSPADRALARRNLLVFAGASVTGLAAMCAIYFVGWGRPLPSSFYAKVGGLRFGPKMWFAVQEMILAGRALPFIAAGLALLGGVIGMLSSQHSKETDNTAKATNETRWASLLLLLASAFYIAALMLTLPWFGQEDRYLLPLHPLVIVLIGILLWRVIALFSLDRLLAAPVVRAAVFGIVSLLLVSVDYLWATRDYAVEVRNIRDAHILPALWIASNTDANSVIASEPIGAVRLFSGRGTIDLVGLTTPATLGTYRDWPRAWPALHSAGATHLFFYPDWFDDATPPAWAEEAQRFSIPDNRIAGSSVIAIYALDWSRFVGSP
ncbi:MAG: hypothetical protein ABIQ44_11125 [Chloroflexia bacterium]